MYWDAAAQRLDVEMAFEFNWLRGDVPPTLGLQYLLQELDL